MPSVPFLVTFYFWRHTDCGVCKIAEPIFDDFMKDKKVLSKDLSVFVIKLDTTYLTWKKHGWEPRGTPAYMLEVNGEPVWKHLGGLRIKELTQVWNQLMTKINSND